MSIQTQIEVFGSNSLKTDLENEKGYSDVSKPTLHLLS